MPMSLEEQLSAAQAEIERLRKLSEIDEHNARMATRMVRERDAEIERLRAELVDIRYAYSLQEGLHKATMIENLDLRLASDPMLPTKLTNLCNLAERVCNNIQRGWPNGHDGSSVLLSEAVEAIKAGRA